MRYLGIDYGTKKIGIAISDENGRIAFPYRLLKQDGKLFENIEKIIQDKKIEAIVVGKSLSLNGEKNILQKYIDSFILKIKKKFSGEIFEEDERLSSLSAKSHLYGKGNRAKNRWTGRENAKKREAIDPAAASIILQRFLDRIN